MSGLAAVGGGGGGVAGSVWDVHYAVRSIWARWQQLAPGVNGVAWAPSELLAGDTLGINQRAVAPVELSTSTWVEVVGQAGNSSSVGPLLTFAMYEPGTTKQIDLQVAPDFPAATRGWDGTGSFPYAVTFSAPTDDTPVVTVPVRGPARGWFRRSRRRAV